MFKINNLELEFVLDNLVNYPFLMTVDYYVT
jgi:hypothetical protein